MCVRFSQASTVEKELLSVVKVVVRESPNISSHQSNIESCQSLRKFKALWAVSGYTIVRTLKFDWLID